MIIVSQDKTEIINFDRITEIVASENNICIADHIEQKRGYIIATYGTEDRAKQVLAEIVAAYSNFKYYASEKGSNKDRIGIKIFKEYGSIEIYEMPEE